MIDQSYSADNFYRILDLENRKGNYVEGIYFSNIAEINIEIKQRKITYRDQKAELKNIEERIELKEVFQRDLKKILDDKYLLLNQELHNVSANIVNDKWEFELKKHFDTKTGKDVFLTGDNPETFFAIKQTQYCIKKLYKVKQSHRNNIVQQVKLLLEDKSPKAIIRADISNFYESISTDTLLRKINKENLLSQLAKKIIGKTIRKYQYLTDSKSGVPRGVGISAYLSELYLREFDNEIKSLPNVFYYARYVDDIIIFMTVNDDMEPKDLKLLISAILAKNCKLELNNKKWETHIIRNINNDLRMPKSIEYLGYKFVLSDKGKLDITLSERKFNGYKEKLDKLFAHYHGGGGRKIDRKLLVNGIRFLTSNTRLLNNKSNVLIGIFYSNVLLNNYTVLDDLDKYIEHKLGEAKLESLHAYIVNKDYSFKKGFLERKFTSFKPNKMGSILSIWN